jgi:hypothetical protein
MSPGRRSPFEKKGRTGGFEFDFNCCHRLDFCNEFQRHHTVKNLAFKQDGIELEKVFTGR